jgi:drug/metabolite transporter (DMT)-like permease
MRERIGRWMLVGIACAVLGSGLIFLADAGRSAADTTAANPTLGNGLALLASVLVCGYLLLGRCLSKSSATRQAMNVLAYATLVYSFAAIALLVVALATSTPMAGYSVLGWGCLIALAIGPQLIGHTAINWSLKHLSPAFVAVAILGEPIGSAVWAYFLFDEKVLPLQMAGFVVLLVGIAISSQDARD